jgi:hypothetical protein
MGVLVKFHRWVRNGERCSGENKLALDHCYAALKTMNPLLWGRLVKLAEKIVRVDERG